MRFAHDAHVIPVMASSTCSLWWVVLIACSCPRAWRRGPGSGDVVAGLVDRGTHGRVVELHAADRDPPGLEVDVHRRDPGYLLDLARDRGAAMAAAHVWNRIDQLLDGLAHLAILSW